MKSKIIITTIMALPLAVASCSNDAETNAGQSEAAPASTDDYALTTCVVSGEELGSMGDPIEYDHNGTVVKFCCKSCIPKFEAEPEKYVAKLKQ
jgi:YHS domain-containing protein